MLFVPVDAALHGVPLAVVDGVERRRSPAGQVSRAGFNGGSELTR